MGFSSATQSGTGLSAGGEAPAFVNSVMHNGSGPRWGGFSPAPSRPRSHDSTLRSGRSRSPPITSFDNNNMHDTLNRHLETVQNALMLHHHFALQAVAGRSEDGKINRLIAENKALRAALLSHGQRVPSRPCSPNPNRMAEQASLGEDAYMGWSAWQCPESKPALPPLPVFDENPARPESRGRPGNKRVAPPPISDAPRLAAQPPAIMPQQGKYAILSKTVAAGAPHPCGFAQGWSGWGGHNQKGGMGMDGRAIGHPAHRKSTDSERLHSDVHETATGRGSRGDDAGHPGFNVLEVWQRDAGRGYGSIYARLANNAKVSDDDIDDIIKDSESEASGRVQVQKKDCCRKFVVYPYAPGRSAWDIMSLFFVVYDMVMIPMGMFDLPEATFLLVMQWMTRVFWTLDMPLSFVSGFVTSDGTIEMRPSKICRRYVRSWFCLDVLVVGVDWLELVMSAFAEGLGIARLGKASRIFRILRMIRLLRLARMTEVLSFLTERINSEKLVIVLDILKLLVIMVGGGHGVACIWYALGKAESSENWLKEFEYVDEHLGFRYVMSLRWAMSQFAGGMDEVHPVSMIENVYAIVVFLFAFWSGAVFLSILTSSMTQFYIIGSQTSQQLVTLRQYLAQNRISNKLALRVTRNAQHAMAEQQRSMPEAGVLLIKKVSEPLRVELHFEMFSPMLCVHPFFARYIVECPHVVRKVCHQAMEKAAVSVGDIIFNVGEIPAKPKMFIVTMGQLRYNSVADGKHIVNEGQWISEAPLWVPWVHRGLLVAVADSYLCTLAAKEFQAIVDQFEHIGFDPRDYAKRFAEELNNHVGEVNDLTGCSEQDAVKMCTDGEGDNPRQRLSATPIGSLIRAGKQLPKIHDSKAPTKWGRGLTTRHKTVRPHLVQSGVYAADDGETKAPSADQEQLRAEKPAEEERGAQNANALPGSLPDWVTEEVY